MVKVGEFTVPKMGGKKCVVSTEGKQVSGVKELTKAPVFHAYKGEHITTITLHYCTALGLVLNKILDAPPKIFHNGESKKKLGKKKRANTSTKLPAVSPVGKRAKPEPAGDSVEVVTVQKTCELVDLTGDSEEEIDLTGEEGYF